MKSILIRDTTREERIRIVNSALWGSCGTECEFCNGCDNLGGGRIESIYQPTSTASRRFERLTRSTARLWRRGEAGEGAGLSALRVFAAHFTARTAHMLAARPRPAPCACSPRTSQPAPRTCSPRTHGPRLAHARRAPQPAPRACLPPAHLTPSGGHTPPETSAPRRRTSSPGRYPG